jgi:hypothetical protein
MSTVIERLERELYAALEARDDDALDRLFADDLIYVHYQGISDTKSATLTGVRTGLFSYRSVVPRNTRTHVYGDDLAVTVGIIDVIDSHRPTERLTQHQALAWQRRGENWVLVSRIATLVGIETIAAHSKERS